MGDVRPTTEMMWWTTLALAALDAGLLLLVEPDPPGVSRQRLPAVSAASALGLGVAEFVVYWSLIVGLAALGATLGSWERSRPLASRRAHAWALLSLVLGLHVADEAAHDFLSLYNPTVLAIRDRVPWLPLPTFGWWQWLLGLAAAVVTLLAITPLVRRGHRIMLFLGVVFGLLMAGNALLHLVGSLALSRPLPGVWSAPLLLAASLALLFTLRAGPSLKRA